MQRLAVTLAALWLAGCGTVRQGFLAEGLELVTLDAAQAIVRARLPAFDPARVELEDRPLAFLGCGGSPRTVPIEWLAAARHSATVWGSELFVTSDHPSLAGCARGLRLRGPNVEEGRRLVLALNVLGARIPALLSDTP